ncbi:MAG: hypothetical protein J6R88_04840 [Clostridia bacterium]|nr:hypothetical protein [Clostridia bacterium]
MLLVEKRRIIEQQIDASVVIVALEEDKLSVTDFMTELNVVGLNYVLLTKNKSIENDYWYWRASEEALKKAGCIIVVMTKAFFAPENEERRKAVWYEVGVMEARGLSVIPYMLGIDKSEWDGYLTTTPIRQKQATGNFGDLIKQIEASRLFKKNFFTDRNVAFYGNSRVFYSEISVLFNIKKEAVDNILARLRLLEDEDMDTSQEILNILHKEIHFGIKLHRFGKTAFTEHPYYSVYEKEAEILNIDCAPQNTYNRFTLLSQNLNNGSYAVKVDFIFPNHEVFGVAFKPYMEIQKNSPIRKGDIFKILELETTKEVFENKLDAVCVPTDKTQRIYFNLYFDDDQMLFECNDEEIGKTCNFIYAK